MAGIPQSFLDLLEPFQIELQGSPKTMHVFLRCVCVICLIESIIQATMALITLAISVEIAQGVERAQGVEIA